MTTHDDSLLFVAGLLIVLSWALARGRTLAWLARRARLRPTSSTRSSLNNRRLAWIELLLVWRLPVRSCFRAAACAGA